jgi:hypothetical protein
LFLSHSTCFALLGKYIDNAFRKCDFLGTQLGKN